MKDSKGELVELTEDETPSRACLGKSLDENVKFRFYTRAYPTNYQQITLHRRSMTISSPLTNFRVNRPSVLITHGYISGGDDASCTVIRDALLKSYDRNVIIVDWSDIYCSSYKWAVKQTRNVGIHVAAMIDYLESYKGLNTEKTTLVGHSLGPHNVGIAGFYARGYIGTIFGLDPALPMFKYAIPGFRISRYDADHVQIIHTNAGALGYDRPIVRSDFYVDGGITQSDCLFDFGFICSHSRAYELFAESLSTLVGFWGKRCTSSAHFLLGRCRDPNVARMGGIEIDDKARGSYYVATRHEGPPYAAGIFA